MLRKTVCCLCLICLCFPFHRLNSQSVVIKTEVDTVAQTLQTNVCFIDIPADISLRWQQRIHPQAKLLSYDSVSVLSDTSDGVFTVIWAKFPAADTFVYSFTVYFPEGLPYVFSWGEGALLYVDSVQGIRKIKDWSKRNDHRHHAMDALTIAFTKRAFIQYLNNLNARSDKSSSIYGIEQNELYRNGKGKMLFKPPMPLDEFRTEAKRHLENTLISIKAKNKVVTQNINTTKKSGGTNRKVQLTPRGQLHNETIYGSQKKYIVKEETVNAKFDLAKIATVTKLRYKKALLQRLNEFGNDPKKAFTGTNALSKKPIWINELHTEKVPEKVKTLSIETVYTIRKDISPDLKIDKVIDKRVKEVLEARLKEFNGNAKQAFSNLDENPIWLNKEKSISIKRVTITGVSNAEPLHDKRDKEGNIILSNDGKKQAVDFVSTSNNHHVAIYRDADGNLQDYVVSFYEAVCRRNLGLPIIDKEFKVKEGWTFLFSMKQNEYFVFPNEKTGFNPLEVDLLNSDNYALISPNLFRVQTMSKVIYGNNIIRDYKFRHHLETSVKDIIELKNITYKQYKTLNFINNIYKVRINHIGQIVSVGEY
jgi:CRISPR-associated endonuclease Csn1